MTYDPDKLVATIDDLKEAMQIGFEAIEISAVIKQRTHTRQTLEIELQLKNDLYSDPLGLRVRVNSTFILDSPEGQNWNIFPFVIPYGKKELKMEAMLFTSNIVSYHTVIAIIAKLKYGIYS